MDFKEWLTWEEDREADAWKALAALCEDDIVGASRAKELRQVLKQAGMPRGKRDHSERVTKSVHALFVPPKDTRKMAKKGIIPQLDQSQWTTVMAALFHDYLERGGDHSVLNKLGLPPQTIQVINALTSDKGDSDPLEHLQEVLPTLDDDMKNMVILIKLSDRLDNLTKRADVGKIGRGYMEKSNQLVKWLFQQYTGNPDHIMILRKRLRNLGIKARKRYIPQQPVMQPLTTPQVTTSTPAPVQFSPTPRYPSQP